MSLLDSAPPKRLLRSLTPLNHSGRENNKSDAAERFMITDILTHYGGLFSLVNLSYRQACMNSRGFSNSASYCHEQPRRIDGVIPPNHLKEPYPFSKDDGHKSRRSLQCHSVTDLGELHALFIFTRTTI